MKKAFCLTFLLIILAVTLIADTPMVASSTGNFSGDRTAGSRLSGSELAGSELSGSDAVPMDAMKSRVPIPAPSTLLLIGSGIIGLIIYRQKHKNQE